MKFAVADKFDLHTCNFKQYADVKRDTMCLSVTELLLDIVFVLLNVALMHAINVLIHTCKR